MTNGCRISPGTGPNLLGREAVMAATLPSAAELFGEKGAAATSIREIAAHAGVNHGLVYRYFGTKEKLLGATLDYLADRTAESLKSGAPSTDTRAALNRQLRVAVRAVLDGYSLVELQTRFPGIELILDQIEARFDNKDQARLATAHAIALNLSWQLFGTTLKDIVGLTTLTNADINESLNTQINRITNQDGPLRN